MYFGDNAGQLKALNAATGTVQCTFTLPFGPPATKPGRIFSSPVVGSVDGTGPTVFFGDAGGSPPSPTEASNGGHLWAVAGVGNTAGSCKERWAYSNWPDKGTNGTMTGVWDEPALVREGNGTAAVVFGTSNPDGAVYALNAATGPRQILAAFRTFAPPRILAEKMAGAITPLALVFPGASVAAPLPIGLDSPSALAFESSAQKTNT